MGVRYEWLDWGLASGIVLFLALVVFASSYHFAPGDVWPPAVLASLCAYFYGARGPSRRAAEGSAPVARSSGLPPAPPGVA